MAHEQADLFVFRESFWEVFQEYAELHSPGFYLGHAS